MSISHTSQVKALSLLPSLQYIVSGSSESKDLLSLVGAESSSLYGGSDGKEACLRRRIRRVSEIWPYTPKTDTATWAFWGLVSMVTCDMFFVFYEIVTWDMAIS